MSAHERVYCHVGVKQGEALPAYTSIGCYPILYYTKQGETLCAACATEEAAQEDSDDPVMYADVYWEGESESCAGCSKELESAYGPVSEDKS